MNQWNWNPNEAHSKWTSANLESVAWLNAYGGQQYCSPNRKFI